MVRSEHGPPAIDLADALSELANLMLATPSLADLLEQLARLAAGVLSPPGSCGITLSQDHRALTVASSDARAAQLDEVQYGQDDGPCLEALRTGRVTVVGDLSTERRWGAYPAHALAHGVRSSLSLPLAVDGDTRGALNLYATTADAFGEEQQQQARILSVQTSTALTLAHRQAEHTTLTDQLREALATRAVIDQAIGILMAQQSCDTETAFGILRTTSQNQNRKLRDIAAELVESVGGPGAGSARFNDPAS
jgi:GAF domain-containing protein